MIGHSVLVLGSVRTEWALELWLLPTLIALVPQEVASVLVASLALWTDVLLARTICKQNNHTSQILLPPPYPLF
jgi:hypothetical protein